MGNCPGAPVEQPVAVVLEYLAGFLQAQVRLLLHLALDLRLVMLGAVMAPEPMLQSRVLCE